MGQPHLDRREIRRLWAGLAGERSAPSTTQRLGRECAWAYPPLAGGGTAPSRRRQDSDTSSSPSRHGPHSPQFCCGCWPPPTTEQGGEVRHKQDHLQEVASARRERRGPPDTPPRGLRHGVRVQDRGERAQSVERPVVAKGSTTIGPTGSAPSAASPSSLKKRALKVWTCGEAARHPSGDAS